MSGRSPEDLERALGAAERRLTELQAWIDSSESEAEALRARVVELEAKGSGEAKVAELGQWLDASELETERLRAQLEEVRKEGHERVSQLTEQLSVAAAEESALRARVAELEAKGAPQGVSRQAAELQQWLDAAEAEAEGLRARVAELEASSQGRGAAPPTDAAGGAELVELRAKVAELTAAGHQAAELQQWLDASEAEVERLSQALAQARQEAQRAHQEEVRHTEEVKAWADSAQEEAEVLRAKVVEDDAVVAQDAKRLHELEAWLASSEAETEQLRTKLAAAEEKAAREEKRAKELQQWLDADEAEADELRHELAEAKPEDAARLKERVAELEAEVGSLSEVNRRLSAQAERTHQREVAHLQAELERARGEGSKEKVEELSALLENAREAIATLEDERRHAIAQVQRYASRDSEVKSDLERRAEALRQEKDARLAVLQASLSQREAELKTLEARVIAYANGEQALKAELEQLRVKECEAREQLAHVRGDRDALELKVSELGEHVVRATTKLEESQRWLASAEQENAALEKKLETERLEAAMREADRAKEAAQVPPAPPRGDEQAGRPAAEVVDEGVEGFSVARLRRLESMLSAETARAEALERFLTVAEKSLAQVKDELELAQARLLDMAKKLGLTDEATADAAMRLRAAGAEVAALAKELAEARGVPKPPPPPLDAFEELAPEKEVDVLSAPMGAVEALTDAQAAVTKQATEALESEQRAKEQLLSDLAWLKGQLQHVSHLRDELRQRLEAMVQRELKRKGVMASLVERLRATEAGAAARAGALRRLQAAIELAQRNAVRVQTIYFQKQIGSLQRQLEVALGKKRPAPAAPRTGPPLTSGPRAVAAVPSSAPPGAGAGRGRAPPR